MRKRILSCIFLAGLFLLTSCQKQKNELAKMTRVMTTIYPVYDWTRNLMNEGKNEKLLLNVVIKNSFDIHLFAPSDADIQQIANAKMVVYTGTKIDSWVKEAVSKSTVENQIVVNLSEVVKTENPDSVLDEHFWLNPENAIFCCNSITEKLCLIDPDNADSYKNYNVEYCKLLGLLALDYKNTLEANAGNALVIPDRFAMADLFSGYGIKCYTLSSVCPAISKYEKSDIEKLSALVDELNCSAIYVTELGDKKIAQAVIDGSKNPRCDIVTIDTLHCTTLNQAFYGKTYLSTMQENLSALKF